MRTEVGYAGGEKSNPTYHDLGSHTEVLEVEFDPTVISYRDLLDLFWAGHVPTRASSGTQYRSILLCEDEAQFATANASIAELETKLGSKVRTDVLVGQPFYPAEGYHQKWKLRQRPAIFDDLATNFETEAALLRSFAATKLNAIAGGHLSRSEVESFGAKLQLSTGSFELLISLLPKKRRAG